MNLRDKYTLGKLVSEGEVKTYAARELGSDSSVLVHCLGAAKVDLMTLVVRRLRSAPPGGSSGVVDMFESEGEVYLITEVIPGFSNLRTWLESESLGPAPKPGSQPLQPERPEAEPPAPGARSRPPEAPHASSDPPSDFTRAFRSPAVDPDAKTSAFASPFLPPAPPPERAEQSKPAAPAAPAKPVTPDQISSEPGEFTRLFDSSSVARAQSAPPSPPSNPVPRPPAGSGLGPPSRTADMEVPGMPRPDLRPPAVAPPSGGERSDAAAGEFTQLFRPSRGDEFIGAEPNAPHFPVSGFDESSRQPGEFTQLFQPSFGDSPVPPEEPLPAGIKGLAERGEPGALTRILRPNRDPDSQAPFGKGSLTAEPVGTSRSASEPGFDTLFGSAPPQDRLTGTREPSGTAIFSAPSSPPVEAASPPDVPPANPAVPPERPAPPVYASREAVAEPPAVPKPTLPPSVPRPPAALTPPAVRPSVGGIAKVPPALQRPALPVTPKVPAPPRPPVGQPLPKAPAIKLPVTPSPSALPPSPASPKPGLSTLELALILGGLLLVVVAVVLLLK